MSERFPIQRAGTVPWKEAEVAYETYVRFFGKSQTLERLAERGGFGVAEFCCLYLGENPMGASRIKLDRLIVITARTLGEDWIL